MLGIGGDLARPDLPLPACRVMLVCGPPAAGKTTYVEDHAAPGDIVIDLDRIAHELGLGRSRSGDDVVTLLEERNARLAALAHAPREQVAWVILTAPSLSLRQWWCHALGVHPTDLVLLVAPREELRRRIMNDPTRAGVWARHLSLVDEWFAREGEDDPGASKRGVDDDGYPTDPLHPFNKPRWDPVV